MVKLIRIKSDIRREGTNVVSIVIDVGMRGPRRPPVQCSVVTTVAPMGPLGIVILSPASGAVRCWCWPDSIDP